MLGEANLIDYSLITGLLVYALAPCNGKGQPSQGAYRLTASTSQRQPATCTARNSIMRTFTSLVGCARFSTWTPRPPGLRNWCVQPGKDQLRCISPVCHPKAGCGETAYKLGDFYNIVPQIFCSGGHPKPPALGKSSCRTPAAMPVSFT